MTINRELNYNNFSTVLRVVLESWARTYLHTSMPGIIDEYDVTTRRARVRPALFLVMTGEEPGKDGESMERALAVNVPVLWSAGGGIMSFFPLSVGDRGMLVFSERGMTAFKQTGDIAMPDKARFFDTSDCIFMPGDFGHPTDPEIVDEEAASIQTYDGHTSIILKRGMIQLKVGESTIVMTEDDILANSDHIGLND